MSDNKTLPSKERKKLLSTLKDRFENNVHHHKNLKWPEIQTRLQAESSAEKLWSLLEMEQTGGEPDVIGYDKQADEFIFCDCSPESPKGRRSVCYDRQALESRKKHQPDDSAVDMAAAMGIELLTEKEYHQLQQLGDFDTKTSTWLKTPAEVRELGGALFGDFRYGRVFIYHNGAQSYYGARGFRGLLRV